MRSGVDGTTLGLYTSGVFDLHARIKVENGSGTKIDLYGRYTRYSLKLPNPNEPIGSLSIDFIRETTKAGASTSLSPTVAASTYNKLNDGSTYSPLLQLGRIVTLDIALTAVGAARPADGAATWYEVFQGYITKVDWPDWDSRQASIDCHGLAGILQIAKSETAYTYTAGTTLDAMARAILNNNGFTSVPIYFPVATGKTIPIDYAPGLQKTVWSQLWDLAQSMGWICYYRYRGQAAPELTFFAPARGKVSSDMTIAAHDFKAMAIDETEVRNAGYLAFWNIAGAQELIGPAVDSASIVKYGGSKAIRRPFWISLEKESPIRATSEATAMLNAALSDVSDPDVIAQALTFPLVFAESGVDLYTFSTMVPFFDSAQTLAPFDVSVEQRVNEEAVSVTGVRGIPTAGGRTWKRYTGKEEPDYGTAFPYVDVDGDELWLYPNLNMGVTSFKYRVDIDDSLYSEVNTLGILSVADKVLVHTFTTPGERVVVGFIAYAMEDGTGKDTGVINLPATYLDPTAGASLPVVIGYPINSSTIGNEAYQLVATSPTATVALYHRSYTKGNTPPAYTRQPTVGFSADPQLYAYDVVKPAEGAQPVVIEAYAVDAVGVSENVLYIEIDGDAIPSGIFQFEVDNATGAVKVLVNTIDSDTGSWRFKVAVGDPGVAYADPTFVDTGHPEYRGSALPTPIAITGTSFPLAYGKEVVLSGYFFRTVSTVAGTQATSARSPNVRTNYIHKPSVVPVVKVVPSQVGGVGTLTLTVYDPAKRVLVTGGIQSKRKVGAGTWSALADMTVDSGTAGTDPTLVRHTDVDLMAFHNSEIAWVVSYTYDGATRTIAGSQTFDLDTFASGRAWLSLEPDYTVKLNIESEDDDTARGYYKIVVGAPTVSYINATTGDSYVLIGAMPYHTNTAIVLGPGQVAKLSCGFANAANTIDQFVRHEVSGPPAANPGIDITLSAVSSSLRVQLVSHSDSVVWWRAWIKKGAWPTIDGTATGAPDDRYLEVDWPISPATIESIKPGLSDGTFYVIAQGYDVYGNPGGSDTATLVVSGGGGGGAFLYNITAAAYDGAPDYYRFDWDHSASVDATYDVDIVQYNNYWGNDVSSYGITATNDFAQITSSPALNPGDILLTMYFTITLKTSGGATVATYSAQITDYFNSSPL